MAVLTRNHPIVTKPSAATTCAPGGGAAIRPISHTMDELRPRPGARVPRDVCYYCSTATNWRENDARKHHDQTARRSEG
jgi:Na+-translocating ferredoxin:NAD+ oxidoreductase RNF subunit RnfB